ncbi:MAG: hypothetical protein P4L55_03655 [Syntrophobacteraceae bacterium]|nr:hypothetical protein [Syntrophobacteraceae bacterium]
MAGRFIGAASAFARLERKQRPSASTLRESIKSLGEKTWKAVNRAIIAYTAKAGTEKGRTVRIDSTAVEAGGR